MSGNCICSSSGGCCSKEDEIYEQHVSELKSKGIPWVSLGLGFLTYMLSENNNLRNALLVGGGYYFLAEKKCKCQPLAVQRSTNSD